MSKSIIQQFEETAQKYDSKQAARYRGPDGAWQNSTWGQIDAARKEVASGLLQLGLQAGQRVNILSNSCMDWVLADLGILSTGGETVPIYHSTRVEDCQFIIEDCEAVFVFAEDKEQLEKLQQVKAQIPKVQKVIVFSGETDDSDWTVSFQALRELGRDYLSSNESTIRERSDALTEESVLTLIYTSGTTGRPKGVVLTHSNMAKTAEASLKIDLILPSDVQLFFLPLAHVFAKVLECIWFSSGHEMVIDSEITRITANMAEVKPTVMASVPRIFEKVYAKVVGNGLEAPGVKGRLFKWALDVQDQIAQRLLEKKPVPWTLNVQMSLAKALVFKKVAERLNGIFGGKIRHFISGGAPLPKKMAYFFEAAGVVIMEGYGLTETSAASCVNRMEDNRIGSVGPPLPGTEIKIAPDGEVLIRGPGVMREYWNRPDATADVLSGDGWFASGDIGEVDKDGYLYITDRKKDIIVTAGGKNIAPQNIESAVKSANPLISQVLVHGDKRKFLVALVTLEPEAAQALGKERGVGTDYAAVCRSDVAFKEVEGTIGRVNANLARFETIKSFRILERDFEVGDELTPTLKVKRKHCNAKFQPILDAFYDERVD